METPVPHSNEPNGSIGFTPQPSINDFPLVPYTIFAIQGDKNYRRGSPCFFYLKIDWRELKGRCPVFGGKMAPNASGLYILVQCFIEGEENQTRLTERITYFDGQVLEWNDGKASIVQINPVTDFKIPLFLVNKGDTTRNRKHYVSVTLYRDNHILAKSDRNLLNFRLGKRDDGTKPKKQEMQKSLPMQVASSIETWNVDRVMEYFVMLHQTTKVAEDYSPLLKDHNIQGEILKAMTKQDWIEIGITKIGDIKMIQKMIHEL